MKVLFISSQALFSETRFGGAKRLYYLARELESKVELHLLCMDSCAEFSEGRPFPREFKRQLFLPSDPLWKRRSMFSSDKLSFLPGMNEIISRNRRAIEAFSKDQDFDATLFAFTPSLYLLQQGRTSRMGRIFYLEDDLVLENAWRDVLKGRTWKHRAIAFVRYWQGLAFFRRKLRGVSSFICISREEEDVVRKSFPFVSTGILKYGIPLGDYPSLPLTEKKSVLGFIGNHQHLPNIDALHWLVDDLFPHFLSRVPEARLVLGGKNFPREILEKCARNPAIRIMENVERLGDFYDAIGTFVNPLREGRGLRTKVIESAAFGRPVLSTALGAEGLRELRIGIFENREELVDAFLSESRDGNHEVAARHNRDVVERFFSVEKVGDDLMEILAR